MHAVVGAVTVSARQDQFHHALATIGVPVVDQRPSMLVSWVVMSEWIDEDGHRWLSRMESQGLPDWTIRGMLLAGVDDDWEPEDE